jgi:cyclic pyranopterin phosphate synthase
VGPAALLALRISVTDHCQLRCEYCRPLELVPRMAKGQILRPNEIVRFVRLVQDHLGLAKVRLTGGDPLVRDDIVEVAAALSSLGVPDLAMTTNGQRLAELAFPLHQAGLHRITVSLDSLKPEVFHNLARGGALSRSLDGIEAALTSGLRPLKINTVVMRGVNHDELHQLVDFAFARDAEARFIELMPTGLSPERYQQWFFSSQEVLTALGQNFQLTPLVYQSGSSSRRFHATDAKGREGIVGLISPNTQPFCAGCNRLRLTADGHLVGCLGRTDTLAIGSPLREISDESDQLIVTTCQAALACKRTISFKPPTDMSAVGG